jgi:hypothetical protein
MEKSVAAVFTRTIYFSVSLSTLTAQKFNVLPYAAFITTTFASTRKTF